MPGVQKPHCSAFFSWKAFCSRASSPESLRPSMVSTRQPFACTASIRQPRTISPSTRTRAGAAHAVLAAGVRAGQAEFLAQEIDQVLARLHAPADLGAIDRQRDVESVFHARSSRMPARCSLVADAL